MPAIDLTAFQAEADCTLNKFTVKADSGDEDAFIYDLHLVFPVTSVQEAEVFGRLIPGARDIFERSTEPDNNEKFSQTVTPAIKGMRVDVSHAKAGLVAAKGGADLLSVQMRGSKRVVTVTVKIRMGGQTEHTASELTRLLRNAACLSTEQSQQPIPFPAHKMSEPGIGDVVVAQYPNGTTIYGVRVENNEGTVMVVDDFGSQAEVEPGQIQSFYGVTADSGADLAKLLASFVTKCSKRDIRPTWAALTVALGQQYGAGEDTFNGKVHRVNKATIDRAVAILDTDAQGLAGGAVGEA